MSDPCVEARDEALWGLALRRDRAAVRLLLDRLNGEEWVAGDEMAAAGILGLDSGAPVEVLRAGLRELL